MNGWRPELTAATADSDALTRPGLRVVPPPAAHARAGRGGFSRGRVRTLFAADIAAILISLAATYVLAEQIGPPAVIGPTWLFVALVPVITVGWLALFGTYRLYEGQSRAIARKSFDEVSTLFNALMAGSLLLLVVNQGLKKGFDIFLYSPLEALFFLSFAIVLVPTLRGVVRTWLLPNMMRPRRTLKNLFQEAGVPPWERDRLPLIVCGDDLVWVPGLGVDVRYRAPKNGPGVLPEWRKMPR